jgi:hypothetical protein
MVVEILQLKRQPQETCRMLFKGAGEAPVEGDQAAQ